MSFSTQGRSPSCCGAQHTTEGELHCFLKRPYLRILTQSSRQSSAMIEDPRHTGEQARNANTTHHKGFAWCIALKL